MATSTGRDDNERLLRGYSGRIFVVALGTLVASLGRQALPPLLPAIIEGLAITPAAAGFAMTLMRICFAVCQYPSGRVADTVSRKIAIVGGLGGMVAGFVVLTRVPSYPVFLLSTALLGIGSAFFFDAVDCVRTSWQMRSRNGFGKNSFVRTAPRDVTLCQFTSIPEVPEPTPSRITLLS